MSIDWRASTWRNSALHFVGNGLQDENLALSHQEFSPDADTQELLWQHLEKAFPTPQRFRLRGESPLRNQVAAVFADESCFLAVSQNIAQALHSRSQKPGVKSGELLVALLQNLSLDGSTASALLLIKWDHKQPFLFATEQNQAWELQSYPGMLPGKVDKAALILNVESDEGYRVLAADHRTNGEAAQFWMKDFLAVQELPTDYQHTRDFMEHTRKFIDQDLGPEGEEGALERLEKVALLQKSAAFVEEHDHIDPQEFGLQVFEDPAIADRFRAYTAVQEAEGPETFPVSPEAVKKHRGMFRSILKLDKNFHVYIHGNRQMMEHGQEPDGRKFYKLYYEEES